MPPEGAGLDAAVNTANPVFFLDVSPDWYRQPSVKVAFALSLLVHAAAIAWLPGLRVPQREQPAPLIVELAPLPQPPSRSTLEEAQPPPEPKPVVRRAEPLQKSRPEPLPTPVPTRAEPLPPPPLEVQRELRPEPAPVVPVPEVRLEGPPPPPQVHPESPPPLPQTHAESQPPSPPNEPQVVAKPQALPVVRQPAASLDPGALKAYGEILAQAIGKRKAYPRLARMRNWQGTTELKLEIGLDGKLRQVSVGHSSGFEVLDAAAVKMAQEAVPFPEVPESLRGRELTMTVPVAFKLESL